MKSQQVTRSLATTTLVLPSLLVVNWQQRRKNDVYMIGTTTDQPCKQPACKDRSDDLRASLTSTTKTKTTNQILPPSRNEIGNAGWTLLHSVAAHFPDQPSEDDIESARKFILGFAHLYPCPECREGFLEFCERHPPNFTSQQEFVLWVCMLHNDVNTKLGKETMSCNLKQLNSRWRNHDE